MPLPTPSITPTSSSMQTSSSSSSSQQPQQPHQPQQPPDENACNAFAQRLNNSAALCIEVGQYDRAIWSLQRALRLSKKHMHSRKTESETTQASRSNHCQECTLDGCIAFSEATSLFSSTNKSGNSSPKRLSATLNSMTNVSATTTNTTTITTDHSNIVHHSKKRKISSSDANNINSNNVDAEAVPTPMYTKTNYNGNGNYYVCSTPIRVPRQGLEMGSVLFLIVSFNLALAHHLKATTMSTTVHHRSSSQSKSLAKTIDKALMMYQLVLEYWSKIQQRLEQSNHDDDAADDDESRSCSKTNNYNSIWFRMILHNNLGQFYKWTENPTKEKECLHDLLSAVLLVTDQAKQHGPGNDSVPTAMIGDSNTNTSTSTSTSGRTRRGSGFKRDLEGFLSNTAALILREQCAEAA